MTTTTKPTKPAKPARKAKPVRKNPPDSRRLPEWVEDLMAAEALDDEVVECHRRIQALCLAAKMLDRDCPVPDAGVAEIMEELVGLLPIQRERAEFLLQIHDECAKAHKDQVARYRHYASHLKKGWRMAGGTNEGSNA